MTLAVLGVDAADYELIKKWNCQNLLLLNHRSLKTDSHSLDVPATLEIWPSIATGLHPTDHGVAVDPTQRKTRSIGRQLISKFMMFLPNQIQSRILDAKTSLVGSTLPTTDEPHVFESGAVTNWPGITPCHDWQRGMDWFNKVKDGELSEEEFRRREFGNAGKGLGWLRAQVKAGVPVAGCHIHILDTMGHIYGDHPESLEAAYRDIDDLVGELRSAVDQLVILSDHGMQCSVLGDDNPGVHSHRAFISTTESGPLPASVYDVREYISKQIISETVAESSTTIDAPTEHLEDLGYLD